MLFLKNEKKSSIINRSVKSERWLRQTDKKINQKQNFLIQRIKYSQLNYFKSKKKN